MRSSMTSAKLLPAVLVADLVEDEGEFRTVVMIFVACKIAAVPGPLACPTTEPT